MEKVMINGMSLTLTSGENVVVMSAADLVSWLRSDHAQEGLNSVEKSVCERIAIRINEYALGVMINEGVVD
jgi:hypothetical protein